MPSEQHVASGAGQHRYPPDDDLQHVLSSVHCDFPSGHTIFTTFLLRALVCLHADTFSLPFMQKPKTKKQQFTTPSI